MVIVLPVFTFFLCNKKGTVLWYLLTVNVHCAFTSLQMLSIYSIIIRHMNRTRQMNGRFRCLRTHPRVMNTKLSRKVAKFYSLFIIMIMFYCFITISFIKDIKLFFFLSELQNKLCHLGIRTDQNVRLIKQAHDKTSGLFCEQGHETPGTMTSRKFLT